MIYLIFGHPREGKTYFATEWAYNQILKGKKVITNFPIIIRQKSLMKKEQIYSSWVWKPEYVYEGITDSLIIMDEAYREVSSRDWSKFDKDKHTFFATNGHNNNDIVVIAQDPARVDTIIREMTNVFLWVRKYQIPIINYPLFFVIEGYTSEEQLQKRFSKTEEAIYTKEFLRFKRKVARSYDTHYYRTQKKVPGMVSWYERLYPERFDRLIQWAKGEEKV